MPHTDPISDMFTRIRNAQSAGHKNVSVPASKIKQKILEVMAREGIIEQFRAMKDNGKSFFNVIVKYRASGEPLIRVIKRVSRPGLRKYYGYKEIPKIKSGFGMSIISTSKGLMSDSEARANKIGGEIICSLY